MEFYGTIGPTCADRIILKQMTEVGMTGIRINLSHGSLREHTEWLSLLRESGVKQLLIDLQGPELRLGKLTQPYPLAEGEEICLGEGGTVPCPSILIEAVAEGQELLIDDGKLLFRVETHTPSSLRCRVLRGGVLQSRKSIAAPNLDITPPTLTEEDLENLRVASSYGVTGVMLPFVRGLSDIRNLKRALTDCGASHIRIFAKIENQMGVKALPEFIREVDEVVIARGDLGNSMPLWELPGCQKRLAAACRAAGTRFIVVTQMLDSMRRRAVPTRAEVCDIYNAVMDGASGVMLTGETAAGQYPVESMRYLVNTARCALADKNNFCPSLSESKDELHQQNIHQCPSPDGKQSVALP